MTEPGPLFSMARILWKTARASLQNCMTPCARVPVKQSRKTLPVVLAGRPHRGVQRGEQSAGGPLRLTEAVGGRRRG